MHSISILWQANGSRISVPVHMISSSSLFAQNLSADMFNKRLQLDEIGSSQKVSLNKVGDNNLNHNPYNVAYASQIAGQNQAVRNINHSIAMIAAAESALSQVNSKLTIMRTLATEAGQTSKTALERHYLNVEFKSLNNQIQTISTTTTWRGKDLLDGSLGNINIQIGTKENQTLRIVFPDINTDFGATEGTQAGFDAVSAADLDIFTNLSLSDASTSAGDEAIDLNSLVITGNDQSTVIKYIGTAMARVSHLQSDLDVTVDQLAHKIQYINNNTNIVRRSLENLMTAQDAEKIAQLSKSQILQQAGSARLIQANHSANSVISLLNGT